jgi:hypothetical protein
MEEEFWRRLPLPIAEIGAALQPNAPGYFESVMRLAWATLLLTTWIEVAARQREGRHVDPALLGGALTKAGHGKMAAAWRSIADPTVSWPMNESDRAFAAICNHARHPKQRFGDAVDALVQVRNQWAHHKLSNEHMLALGPEAEQTVRRLLERHALLQHSRLLYTSKVERIGTSEAYIGVALSGRGAMPFRKGQPQPAPHTLPQGRVFLLDDTTEQFLLDLHPFVVFTPEAGCLLLSELKERGGRLAPIWTRLANGSELSTPELTRDLDLRLPGILQKPAQPQPIAIRAAEPVPEPEVVAPFAPARPARHVLPLVLGASSLVLLALTCLAGTALLAWSRAPASEAIGATHASPSAQPRACDVGLPPTRTPTDIPRWLSGVDVRWAESLEAFDARCHGYARDTELGRCAICAGRDLLPAAGSGIPGVEAITAAFDTRSTGGMFEITVQSTATPDQVAAAFASTFGQHTELRGTTRIWMLGAVRVSLATARASLTQRYGYRATLVARYQPLSEVYYADRDRFCPRE